MLWLAHMTNQTGRTHRFHHRIISMPIFIILVVHCKDLINRQTNQIIIIRIDLIKFTKSQSKLLYPTKKISTFLPLEEIIKNEQEISENETVQKIFIENITHDGYIDDMTRILSFHSDFLKEYIKFHNYLMYGQGALPYELRHYIAIMASSRHKCLYLVNQQENEFISQKGQKSWLLGIENIPQKLKDLNELNKLICHQPWLINENHIEKLLKNQYNSWSITELIMAVTILTHFHAMSGFIFGSGINENYMDEIALKKQKEVEIEIEEKNRLERNRLISNIKKCSGNRTVVKYNHMHSNDTESEQSEDEEIEEEFEEEITENEPENEEFDHIDSYYDSSRSHSRDNYNNRSRSGSNSSVNRTLSNSSASSCEIGIDLLLKEMQVIQADDKYKHESSNHIPIGKLAESDLPITPTQMFLKNTSGTNTLTNSPISSVVSSGQINYLTDLSNCATVKTSASGYHKSNWASHQNFNDLQDENNTDDQNIEIDEDSDFDGDVNTYENQLHFDQSFDDLKAMKSNNTKHLKKIHHQHPNRSISVNCLPKSQLNSASKQSETESHIGPNSLNSSYLLKYLQDPDFTRLNFKNADQTLRLEYFTWENQGYRTANSFYPDLCELLDKNFRVAGSMTYNTMGSHKQVDTSVFRRAVWIYIHSLFGIRYDDYDYNQIKQLISSTLRKFIKIICSCPERITKKNYDKIMKEFSHSEKIHINIVIMEARVQASILFFLRAVNSYFSSNLL